MALIKVKDLAYGRLRSPDLDAAEEFLTHFGMIRAARTPSALYMRGTDPGHHLHVTEKGDPAFVGLAYYAASEDDLKRVAKAPGASGVESIDEPGGGRRVRLREPNGYQVEVVYGIEPLPPIPVPGQHMNSGLEPLRRAGDLMRLRPSPSPIKRMGHGVLGTPKVKETVQWFRETLGFICSDDVYAGDKSNVIGSFNRCDRGDEYVDHHTFFCVHNERAGLNHMSFEVPDVDAVFKDHEYLTRLGKYDHMWGVGRHLLGSQVYDYWADPWGRVHERWADTDRLNAKSGSNLLSAEEGFRSQWGENPPERFIKHVSQ
ncbi:MAG: catechol 1,2-dioxygenase [Candidatus Rokuibacteriota bacterium]|nr:MAG: catechol 1,2-dioxygenase [Candidatus Rokubacteria bacterium]